MIRDRDQRLLSAVTITLPLFVLLAAILVSQIGSSVSSVAIPWYVLQTTHSPALTGLTAFFGLLPIAVGAILGGTLVDRAGYKRSAVIADLVSAVAVGSIPSLYDTVGLPYWVLLLLVLCSSAVQTAGTSARTAILLGLAKQGGISLEKVSSMEELALNLPLLVGPLVAGILIGTMGASQVLWIDAASFLLSAIAIGILLPGSTGHRERSASFVQDLREGIAYVLEERALLYLMLVAAALVLIISPIPSVLLPIYVKQVFGDPFYVGLLVTALGIGVLVGIVLFGILGAKLRRKPIIVASVASVGLTSLVFAAFPPLTVLLVMAVVSGVFFGPFNPLLQTVAGERVPENLRARVFGVLGAMMTSTGPIGVLVVGFGVEALGVRFFMYAIACVTLLLTVAICWSRPLSCIERQTVTKA